MNAHRSRSGRRRGRRRRQRRMVLRMRRLLRGEPDRDKDGIRRPVTVPSLAAASPPRVIARPALAAPVARTQPAALGSTEDNRYAPTWEDRRSCRQPDALHPAVQMNLDAGTEPARRV
jgi:hypothetical protein